MTTAMTTLGTALVVGASILSFGLADGLEHALLVSADELDLVVLRRGAQDEPSSGIDRQVAENVATLRGIQLDERGDPLCSKEYVIVLMKPRRGEGGTTNLIVRGLENVGRRLRPSFRIVEGRDLVPGKFEAITSRRMAHRFENAAIGEKMRINNADFLIVGYFEAEGCAAESEIWTDLRDLTQVRKTYGGLSSINLRAQNDAAKRVLIERLEGDEQFNLRVFDEPQYFKEQMQSAIAIRVVGYFIAGFLTVGAMFAAANTMYAAVASRAREIGTMRALGYGRISILLSFLFESSVLCLIGGLAGCLAVLPFNGYSTGTANFQTFTEIVFSFNFGPVVLLQGVLLSLVMGLIGGLFPAVRAVRLNIIQALRER
jgi:putative ABC transport system permease protein